MRLRAWLLPCVLVVCVSAAVPGGTLAQRHAAATTSQVAAVVAATLTRDAPAPVRQAIAEMLQASATFRRQCQRLAAAQRVHIRMHVDPRLSGASWRARTSISRRDGQVVAAQVLLPMSLQAVELIAHELEHILEQLDGVDLAHHVGTGAVWKDAEGSFETARATAIGRRVAQEVRDNGRLTTRR